MALFDPDESEIASMNRTQIEELRWQKLQQLLRRVSETNGFYQRTFARAGVDIAKLKTVEDFSRYVPFVTKKDFLEDQKLNPPYGDRLGVPVNSLRQIHLTSGTTGIGQEIYGLTSRDMELAARCWVIHLNVMGLEPGDISVNTWPVATMAAGLGVAEGCRHLSLNPLLLGIYDTDTKLRFMKDFSPHHLVATPTYLTRLGVVLRSAGIDPAKEFPRLKGISIAAESYPMEWVAAAEELWGVKVFEVYGLSQNGTNVAGSCHLGVLPGGRRGSLHFYEHLTFTEVVNHVTGEPVEYGEEGELVITTLSREASPVIRFRTGDKVRLYPAAECPCGSPLDYIEAGTIARYDDMLKIKAANVWPQAVDDIVFGYPQVEEYSGLVSLDAVGREEATVRVEFKQETGFEERKAILSELMVKIKMKTQVTMQVEEVQYGALERATFKSRRWLDQRKEGLRNVVKFTEKV